MWTLSTNDGGNSPLRWNGTVMTRMTPLPERNERFARDYTPVALTQCGTSLLGDPGRR